MEKFEKTTHEEHPAISVYDNLTFCQRFLCRSDWFKNYSDPKWDTNQNLIINEQKVNIISISDLYTLITFENESFQEQVFDWIQEYNFESPEYWRKLALPILDKLKSNKTPLIKEGLSDLKDWVNNYNGEYVNLSLDSADLSLFGYSYDTFLEGDLWPNPLFDDILENHKNELDTYDLFNLIEALFNKNEEYQDCKATYTGINYLLEKRTDKIENDIVEIAIHAIGAYEPGHRYFEESLLDRLVDEIFPTFSPTSIIKLLENLHPDNIRGEHLGGYGDNFISLAHIALKKEINDQQRKKLMDLIEKYTD